MERLRQSELERLQVFLRETSTPCDLETFAQRTLPLINDLVEGDVICHAEADPVASKLHSQTLFASGVTASGYNDGSFETYMMSHPVFQHWAAIGQSPAAHTFDFISRREWHRNELYQHIYKPWGTEDSLAIGLPAPPGLIACFCIERARPFTDRECQIMEIVRPHIAIAYRNAEAFSLLGHAAAGEGTESMLLDLQGRPLMNSSGAWELLEHYFPTNDTAPSGLPVDLDSWVRRRLASLGSDAEVPPLVAPLRRQTDGGSALTVRLMRRPVFGEQALLVFQEQRASAYRLPAGLGLSPREEEVLRLAVRGLSSTDIAETLFVSRRTVDKHFENIFNKLGVDSRSAAVAVAIGAG